MTGSCRSVPSATWRVCVGALACGLLLSACGRKPLQATTSLADVSPRAETVAQPPETNAAVKTVESTEVRQAVAEAEKSLRGGSYDEAAAQLLKIRISGVQFSEKDAAAYRNALQEAYSRAIEAAGNGDPRGKAAVEMIRAARGR